MPKNYFTVRVLELIGIDTVMGGKLIEHLKKFYTVTQRNTELGSWRKHKCISRSRCAST